MSKILFLVNGLLFIDCNVKCFENKKEKQLLREYAWHKKTNYRNLYSKKYTEN